MLGIGTTANPIQTPETSTGIDCSPRDEWVTILNYENTESTEVTLAYKKSVGTAFAGNPTEAEAADFFAKFANTIGRRLSLNIKLLVNNIHYSGISDVTGFDWNELSAEEKTETEK